MGDVHDILRAFSEAREKHTDIQTAIEVVCISTGLDKEEVLGVLSVSGVYVLPDSKEEHEIKSFINSVDRTKTVDEMTKEVGFRFCISNKEAKRLVEKWISIV